MNNSDPKYPISSFVMVTTFRKYELTYRIIKKQ